MPANMFASELLAGRKPVQAWTWNRSLLYAEVSRTGFDSDIAHAAGRPVGMPAVTPQV